MKFGTLFFVLAACVAAVGCDLGTYTKRVESAGATYKPPQLVEVVESDEDTPATRLPGEGSPAP